MNEEDRKKLLEFYYQSQENGSKYTSMTYEQGINAVIELLDGDITVEEIIG